MPTLAKLEAAARSCVACVLCETRTNVVFGIGSPKARVMFIGEGPGREEDLAGEPFIGRSGKLLDRLIEQELGVTRAECYIANVVKCRPPENRNPAPAEVTACADFLIGQLQAINPAVIVPLGNFATRSVLRSDEGITKLRGKSYEVDGRTIVPTFHPAAALRGGKGVLAQMEEDFARAKHIVAASVEAST